MAMKTQADAWLGSLATIVVGWFILAFAEWVGGRGRASWGGFLAAGLVSFGVGFGPWSDRDLRGGIPGWPATGQQYSDGLQPVSRAILRIHALAGFFFGDRSRIVTFDESGRERTVATMTTPNRGGDDSGLAQDFVDELIVRAPPGRPRLKAPFVAHEEAVDVALDAGHLLASLGIGTVAGLGLALVARLKARRRTDLEAA